MKKLVKLLALKQPVRVVYGKKPHPAWDAVYEPKFNKWGDVKLHKIKIYNNPDRARSKRVLLAHELIHAWQAENDLADIHGKPFQRMAHKISKRYKLKDIYRRDLDQ